MTQTNGNSGRHLFSGWITSGRTQESLVGYQNEECENVSANMEVRFGLGSWSVFSLWENLRIRLAFMIEGYCYVSEMILEYKNKADSCS